MAVKRRLFKLVVFLLLGAIVNVAVAWGCAWKLDVHRGPGTGKSVNVAGVVGTTPNHRWSVERYERTGATRVSCYYFTPSTPVPYDGDPGSLLPAWNQDYFSGIQRDALNEFERMQDGRGWPMLALWGQAVADSKMSSPPYCEVEYAILLTDFTDPTQFFFGFSGASRAGAILWQVRFLPLHPIWLGFAINTVFYAAILWMLWLSPFVVRRVIRRKRGHCIKCGYDLRATSGGGCPECGWEHPRRQTSPA